MTRRVSVRAIILHEDALLCCRLQPYEGLQEVMKQAWCVPGGGVDDGEALIPALQREMIEETGIVPQVGNLLYVQQFAYLDNDHVEFFFHVTNAEDYLQVDLAKTTHGMLEIAEISFVDPATTHLLPSFLTTEPIAADSNGGAPTKIFSFI